jgi:hypothetical protein
MCPAIDNASHAQGNEPVRHSLLCHFRTAVRLMLALSLGATVMCLFRFPYAVYLAAIPIPILCVVLTLTKPFEGGARAVDLPAANGSGIRYALRQADIVTVRRRMREFRPGRGWTSESSTGRPDREVSFPLRLASKGNCNGFEGGGFPML